MPVDEGCQRQLKVKLATELPVRAKITIKRAGASKLRLLDQDGLPTETPRPIQDGIVDLDTSRDKTLHYVLQF
jgi:hypothetical protein